MYAVNWLPVCLLSWDIANAQSSASYDWWNPWTWWTDDTDYTDYTDYTDDTDYTTTTTDYSWYGSGIDWSWLSNLTAAQWLKLTVVSLKVGLWSTELVYIVDYDQMLYNWYGPAKRRADANWKEPPPPPPKPTPPPPKPTP